MVEDIMFFGESKNIENNIKKLKEYGILKRHDSPKNGYWEIVEK